MNLGSKDVINISQLFAGAYKIKDEFTVNIMFN